MTRESINSSGSTWWSDAWNPRFCVILCQSSSPTISPTPVFECTMPRNSKALVASRKLSRLTPNFLASSDSVGRRSPGCNRSETTSSRICSATRSRMRGRVTVASDLPRVVVETLFFALVTCGPFSRVVRLSDNRTSGSMVGFPLSCSRNPSGVRRHADSRYHRLHLS